MQNIFRCDGFFADAAFGEGHVFGDIGVQMVADHQHIEMFFERIHRKRSRWVSRRGDDIGFTANLDDVGRMAAAGAFGMKRVNRSTLERVDSVFNKATFVQRVGVDHHLDVHVIGDA